MLINSVGVTTKFISINILKTILALLFDVKSKVLLNVNFKKKPDSFSSKSQF